MPIDERTKRLDLEKPAQANTLKNDVARLRESFDKLDDKVATLDPATGKLDAAQIPSDVPRLDANGKMKPEYVNVDAVAALDASGKIDMKNIPDHAVMNVINATSEVTMLDLVDASLGDVCNITNPPYSQFLLVKSDPTQRDSWRELPLKAVTSVNGQTGDITVAEPGANTNITSLEGLTGPTKLGGDAAADYDAVTLRQLRAASGVGQGANMSGVMNNFIGAVEWFNGSRAALPAGYIAADGQLESRTDPKTTDLWAAVSNGMLNSVDDAHWIENTAADPQKPYQRVGNRGFYSSGDGSTNFRIPDLNGIRRKGDTKDGTAFTGEHSVVGTFLRGDGGGSLEGIYASGAINVNAAPNITGSVFAVMGPNYRTNGANSALTGEGNLYNAPPAGADGNNQANQTIAFNASLSSSVYGRENANEIRPNAATGIWIIRANGSFTAASTMFNIIRSDATRPADNTMNYGGFLYSQYMIGQQVMASAAVTAAKSFKNNFTSAILQASDHESGELKNFEVRSDGVVNFPTDKNGYSVIRSQGNIIEFINEVICDSGMHTNPGMGCGVRSAESNYIELNNAPATVSDGSYVNWLRAAWYNESMQFGVIRGGSNNISSVGLTLFGSGGMKQWFFNPDGRVSTTAGNLAIDTGSDRRKKHDIKSIDGVKALKNIAAMDNVEFIYNNDKTNTVRRGFIAQDLEKIDPLYVQLHRDMEGKPDDMTYSLNNGALLMDALAAIKVLAARVAELEAK
ncbi:tail fiber domain-containing protein [Salmonella enterica]|nr:tail fiber domain-containing protein [Salmonella enterica]